jgi:hypothetical protein
MIGVAGPALQVKADVNIAVRPVIASDATAEQIQLRYTPHWVDP